MEKKVSSFQLVIIFIATNISLRENSYLYILHFSL